MAASPLHWVCREAKDKDKREEREETNSKKKGVLLSAKAGWEGEEAGRRVHPEGRRGVTGSQRGRQVHRRCKGR